ncbi:MAG: tRNA (N6-isopentenyl adenosine(37)-C2)-methylthiotransferase MiaB [Dehalococcoidia bacterium]|nr:tRNA (N6-isopentenyl adenosine(37)-C2)-methylthiotransferase MiaB [Dehalococcoidia bacterium]
MTGKKEILPINTGCQTYHIWTIGCQMNRAESERLEVRLAACGYSAASGANNADLIIVNSCVVRQRAEDKVVNKLHNLKALKRDRPHMRIALTGCFVGEDIEALRKQFPYVDDFFPPGEIPEWLNGENCLILPERAAISVYVPIIQGCNNFCTYCIVPYRRGREKSRPLTEIITEVRQLAAGGVKEVTLVGQTVDSYGHDLPDKPDLADLLSEINDIEGLLRLRFLTNHPKDMSPRLIEAMARLSKVCRQVNLPVQAGDDTVLKAMRRGYTVEQYRDLVRRLREAMPDIAITTDLIVGFPGETDEQFKNSYDLMAELKFDAIHIAAYSPRAGTKAALLPDTVPPEVKKSRLAAIEQLEEGIARGINATLIGQTVSVLVEGNDKNRWRGRTRHDKIVFFSGDGGLVGKEVDVIIEHATAWSLVGKLSQAG